MAAKKKTTEPKKSTKNMPKTKKFLGASDAGEAQRTGGLKAAGDYFSAQGVRTGANPAFGRVRQNKLKADVMKKKSSGGGTTRKK